MNFLGTLSRISMNDVTTSSGQGLSLRLLLCLAFTGSAHVAGFFRAVPETCRTTSCDKAKFDAVVEENCVLAFAQSMRNIDYQLECPWPRTRRLYIDLLECVEQQSNLTCCTHTSFRHHVFTHLHTLYFSTCPYLQDPSVSVVLLLVLPCTIITFLTPVFWWRFKLYEQKL